MASDIKNTEEYLKLETKVFNGIVYSMLVIVNASHVNMIVEEEDNSNQEEIHCPDIPADNNKEVF